MGCEATRLAVSLRHDGELPDGPEHDALDAHLVECAECRRFEQDAARLRARLRLEPVDEAPDIAAAVMAELRARPLAPAPRSARRPLVAAAVAAVAGMVAGATFVGIGRTPQSPAAADIPAEVVAAQHDVRSVDARFTLSESSRPDARRGRLAYEAPETLALSVEGGSSLLVDQDAWWQVSRRECLPAPGRVRCLGGTTRWLTKVTGREPFSLTAPIPLELVTPVDSFALAGSDAGGVGRRSIAGHPAVGVTVTAAQVAPFLAGLAEAADLRPVYPSDPVEVWLDADHLVPLAVDVRASDDAWRPRWAAAQGVVDRPGDVIVAFTVTSLRVNEPIPEEAFDPPEGRPDASVDAGFFWAFGRDLVPSPGRLPEGFHEHRAGTVTSRGGPRVGVRSWTDGRAWLTVRATENWSGGRLFGDLGPDVRPLDLGAAGQAYVSADGRLVALHGDGIDVVVGGSLPPDQLQAVAADLGVVGQPVPPSWSEASSGTLTLATDAVSGLLVPRHLDGFGAAAVRLDGETVSQVYAGPGDRGFTLVQDFTAAGLAPSGAGDEVGVAVRGEQGRYSYERSELEWVEAGVSRTLRSPTLTLGELLAIAEGLRPA